MVRADLQDLDPQDGQVGVVCRGRSRNLRTIRGKYSNDDIEINIVGFAKLVGDVIEGPDHGDRLLCDCLCHHRA
jgi:uncharacterized protein